MLFLTFYRVCAFIHQVLPDDHPSMEAVTALLERLVAMSHVLQETETALFASQVRIYAF